MNAINFIDKVIEFFKSLRVPTLIVNNKLLAIIVPILVAIVILLVLIIVWVFKDVGTSLLYGNLSQKEILRIENILSEHMVHYTTIGDSIYIDSKHVYKYRMLLAERGFPRVTKKGYEIFDSEPILSTSEFEQRIKLTRALEGELEKAILTIQNIKDVTVKISLEKSDFLSRNITSSKAAVILSFGDTDETNSALDRAQILGIKRLVASAVNNLSIDNVAVLNDKGFLLDGTSDEDSMLSKIDQFKVKKEMRLESKLLRVLSNIFGKEAVKVSVSVDLETINKKEEEVIYDKDGQVERSKQVIQKDRKGYIPRNEDPITVSTNIPNKNFEALTDTNNESKSEESAFEESANYEISNKIIKSSVIENNIKRVTVGIAIDYTYKSLNNKIVVAPMSEDEKEEVIQLAKDAVGFDASRGDQITLTNIQFSESIQRGSIRIMALRYFNTFFHEFQKLLVLGSVAIVIAIMSRPFVEHLLKVMEPMRDENWLNKASLKDTIEGYDGRSIASIIEEDEGDSVNLEWKKLVTSVNRLATDNPEAFSNLVRAWLYQKE